MQQTASHLDLTVELHSIGVKLYARLFVQDEELRKSIQPPSLLLSLVPLPQLGTLLQEHGSLSEALRAMLCAGNGEENLLAQCCDGALKFARTRSRGLRLRLRIMPTLEEQRASYGELNEAGILRIPKEELEAIEYDKVDWLAYLPWELVLSTDELAKHGDLSLVRSLPQLDTLAPATTRRAKGILDVLLVASDPRDLTSTLSKVAIPGIADLLRNAGRGAFDVVCLDHASPGALAAKLIEKDWDIVHVLAHGTSPVPGDAAAIQAEDEEGLATRVYGGQLRDLWKTGDKALPQLVFLQVCDSAAVYGQLCRGLAQSIHAAGVPYVIGMQAPVSVQSARDFSESFYGRLARLTMAEPIDLAVADARRDLNERRVAERFVQEQLANNPIFRFSRVTTGLRFGAIPVLFMRDDADGRLASTSLPRAIRWPDGKIMLLSRTGQADALYVDKYPVTVGQFAAFDRSWNSPFASDAWRKLIAAEDTTATSPGNATHWKEAIADFPATAVSLEQAKAYGNSFGKRLPTADEWCAAFRETYPSSGPNTDEHNCAKYWQKNRKGKPRPTTVYQFKTSANKKRFQDLPGNCREIVLQYNGPRKIGGSYNDWFDLKTDEYSREEPDLGFRCVLHPSIYRKHLSDADQEKRPTTCDEKDDDDHSAT